MSVLSQADASSPLATALAPFSTFPLQITAWVDGGLDAKNYITPGLGDFGDR